MIQTYPFAAPGIYTFRWIALTVVLVGAGCSGSPAKTSGATDATQPAFDVGSLTRIDYRSAVTSLADTYMTMVTQGLEETRMSTKRSDVLMWVARRRIGLTMASITNAANPSAPAGLLDMIVYARLERIAVEEHWAPNLLKEEAGPVLAGYRRGEQEVWDVARRTLTPEHLDQLDKLIDEWRKAHPGQFYVSHIRFAEFARYRGVTADSPEVKLPGNLFGIFYLDPLAGIDPVVRETREVRLLLERAVYIGLRMPVVFSWQLDLATLNATSTPQMQEVANSTATFARATSDFVKVTADLTTNLGNERKAALDQTAFILNAERTGAIDQVAKELEVQRAGIVQDLNQQQKFLNDLLKNVSGIVAQAEQAVQAASITTSETVVRTQQAATSTVDRIFTWLTALVVLLLVGAPLSAYTNRWARRRQDAPN